MMDMLGLANGGWSAILNLLVYAMMFLLFVLGIIKCVAPVVHNQKLLKRAVRNIRAGQDAKRSWQEDKFLGKGTLYAHWSEYLNNLFFADGAYHNPSRVEDYINEETVIDGPGRGTFADAIPGVLVSMGFLGTLLGIVQGLAGIDLSSTESLMSAITQMLSGMEDAFWTSIVGVVGSLAFQVIQRAVQNSTAHALTAFQDAMRTEARVITVDPMTQITIYQQEQTAQLQAIAEEVTLRMADKMSRALENSIKPMRESLDHFILATTQEQIRGIDIIVQKFVQRMDESLNGQFQQLSASMQESCLWFRQAQESMRAAIEGMNRLSRDVMQAQQLSESLVVKFDGYISRLGAAQQQVDDGFGVISGNIKSMEMVARQQSNYIAQISQMQADFMREVNAFQTRMDTFTKAYVDNTNVSTGALQKVAEELRQSGEGMRENGEKLVASHEAFAKGVHQELQQAFGEFDMNIGQSIERMQKVIDAIGAGMADVPQTMGEASAQYAEQMNQLIEYMKETQQMLNSALDRMGGGAQ